MLEGRFEAISVGFTRLLEAISHYDQTPIHYKMLENKEKSKKLVASGEFALNKVIRSVPSDEKRMATVFYNCRGIIFVDCLERGKTITGAQNAMLLDRLRPELQGKRSRWT